MHNNMSKINTNNNNTIQHTIQHLRSSHTTTQACAACKYQRRKCAPDCILAPYFPHERHRQFLNAHKLFGVSNIIKIIRHLDQQSKDDAMRTIIFQSDVRAADPVGGCCGIIRNLERQINAAKAELEIVLHHLALCKQLALQDQDSSLHCDNHVTHGVSGVDVYDDESLNSNYHHNHLDHIQPPQQIHGYIDHQQQIALMQEEFSAWETHGQESTTSLSFILDNRSVVDHQQCEDIKSTLDLHDEKDQEFEFDPPADENNVEPRFVTLA